MIPLSSPADLAQTPYTERTIERTNTWHWKRDRRVFELRHPEGRPLPDAELLADHRSGAAALRPEGHRRPAGSARGLALQVAPAEQAADDARRAAARRSSRTTSRTPTSGSSRRPPGQAPHGRGRRDDEARPGCPRRACSTTRARSPASRSARARSTSSSASSRAARRAARSRSRPTAAPPSGVVDMDYAISGGEIDFSRHGRLHQRHRPLPPDHRPRPRGHRPQHARRAERRRHPGRACPFLSRGRAAGLRTSCC